LVSAWRPFLFSYLYLGARHKIPIKDLFPSSFYLRVIFVSLSFFDAVG
jgi:hypothetical protein